MALDVPRTPCSLGRRLELRKWYDGIVTFCSRCDHGEEASPLLQAFEAKTLCWWLRMLVNAHEESRRLIEEKEAWPDPSFTK